jgi:membrane-associated phospholipid phosphatase
VKRGDVVEPAGGCALGAWTAFGVLTVVVVGHDGVPRFSDVLGRRHPDVVRRAPTGGGGCVRPWSTATGTGAVPFALAALATLAGIVVGRTLRQRALAVALCLACLGVGQAPRFAVMTLVARPRRLWSGWDTHASGWAFPSGHTTTAAITAGLPIIAVRTRRPRGNTLLVLVIGGWGALVGLVGLVGLTRAYLGVHWFADVVGGRTLVLGRLGVCLCAVAFRLPARWTPDATEMTETTETVRRAKGAMRTTRGPTRGRTDPAREQQGELCARRSWSSRTITACVTC